MYSNKLFVLFALTVTIVNAMPNEEQLVGGIRPADFTKAEEELNASLKKLAAGDGPNYTLGKIYSAETQVVAGTMTRIVADLIDADGKTKKCKVSIWSRSWLPNGIEVTFECDGEEKIVRKHDA
ncbi:sarcocystatin-A-like [Calliphora vicina]|uniref:sarcocystatin-A-like n=1 Tax=Calliphora vicina TaxID=7373 RepID=UPI00325A93DD